MEYAFVRFDWFEAALAALIAITAFVFPYMGGVLLPSCFLLILLAGFLIGGLTRRLPPGLERLLIFPMAAVPNVWGLWNLLYVRLRLKERIPIGVFGAILPLALIPVGIAVTNALDLQAYLPRHVIAALPAIMAVYYLAWKYAVGFFNRALELD